MARSSPGWNPAAASDSLNAYSGLVPMSPKTTPMAPMSAGPRAC